MRRTLSTRLDAVIAALFVTLTSACGGGGGDSGSDSGPEEPTARPYLPAPIPPVPPGAVHLPFTDGDGMPGSYTVALSTRGARADLGYQYACINCIRVVAVAQDAQTAASAIAASPLREGAKPDPAEYLPLLSKVDFSTSSVILFERAVGGTSFRLTITAVEEYADRLRVRSELCSMADPVRLTNSFDGFIVIPKRDKPAEFAPSDTTGLPPAPAYGPDFTLGECRS